MTYLVTLVMFFVNLNIISHTCIKIINGMKTILFL